MSQKMIKNPLYMTYKGVTIYSIHRNNDPNDILREYYFTTRENAEEFSPFVFDIRLYNTWDRKSENVKKALKKAIDQGKIKNT